MTGADFKAADLPRIAIDCSPLLVRSAGVKTWLYYWTRELIQLAPEKVRTVLGAPGAKLSLEGSASAYPRLAWLAALNTLRGGLSDFALGNCDVFHVSNLLRYPPRRAKLSATVHDLTRWILPEMHSAATLKADERFAQILRRADGVVSVSENTRRDAIRILGLPPDKIRVIYPGLPRSYFDAVAKPVPNAGKPWFLFVGTIEPRKNVDGLLDAWLSLPQSWRDQFELRIIGMRGWHAESAMGRLAELNRENNGIRYLGFVAEAELPAMTAKAVALVYPAFYEGFGIPIAQAMAAGCAVITSNVSSMPEVAGDAALLVDPRSPAEIAGAIRRLAESPSLRSELVRRGRERAAIFTWSRAGAESLEYFSALAGR
jgi:glycosyltransferase involved in cell wall biosynthesis